MCDRELFFAALVRACARKPHHSSTRHRSTSPIRPLLLRHNSSLIGKLVLQHINVRNMFVCLSDQYTLSYKLLIKDSFLFLLLRSNVELTLLTLQRHKHHLLACYSGGLTIKRVGNVCWRANPFRGLPLYRGVTRCLPCRSKVTLIEIIHAASSHITNARQSTNGQANNVIRQNMINKHM